MLEALLEDVGELLDVGLGGLARLQRDLGLLVRAAEVRDTLLDRRERVLLDRADRGLDLVEEDDGRMFPKANRSSAVVDCLRQAAKRSGVRLITSSPVQSIAGDLSSGFVASCRGSERFHAHRVLLATGGHPSGRRLASQLSPLRLSSCSLLSLARSRLRTPCGHAPCFSGSVHGLRTRAPSSPLQSLDAPHAACPRCC